MKRKTVIANKVSDFDHSIVEHRLRISAAKPASGPTEVPYKDVLIPLRADASTQIRIYRPKNVTDPCPTLFYIPGTGFVAKEIAFTEVICSHLAEKSNCQVIIINHWLAPEYQFPHGLSDAYKVLKFIINNLYSSFHIDKSKMAIIGYSSGGNFASSMTIYGKADGLPIARQILISPILDLSRSLQDFKEEFEDQDTMITDPFVNWVLNLYIPEGVNRKTPLLSPFWHKKKYLRSLPPTDLIFAQYDRCRSDSQAYYTKLIKAGIDAHKIIVKGENHGFLWHNLTIIEQIGMRIKEFFAIQMPPKQIISLYEQHLYYVNEQIKSYNQAHNSILENHDNTEHSLCHLKAKL